MDNKKFVATIYLADGKAVKTIGNRQVISEEPVLLAKEYFDNNVDQLLIFDLSKSDEEHNKALGIINEICSEIYIPVIVAGNIDKPSDVNTLLEMGVSNIVLNFSKQSNINMTQKLSELHGNEKLYVAVTDTSLYTANEDLILNCCNKIIVMQELVNTEMLKLSKLPIIIPLADIPLDRLMDYLDRDIISGIFGSVVNSNITEINGIKALCSERGIVVDGFDAKLSFSQLKKNSDGLVPCIVQDYENGQVLMMAYMNEEAYNATIKTGRMNYYSRSRSSQWLKGETSGHYQYVHSLYADCDKDTLLAKISQVGAACHTGSRSCFFNDIISR